MGRRAAAQRGARLLLGGIDLNPAFAVHAVLMDNQPLRIHHHHHDGAVVLARDGFAGLGQLLGRIGVDRNKVMRALCGLSGQAESAPVPGRRRHRWLPRLPR